MIRYKTFYNHIDDRVQHDNDIRIFIEQLCNAGHSFISVKTEFFGYTQNLNRMRTEIVYQENPTRSVILEKEEKK